MTGFAWGANESLAVQPDSHTRAPVRDAEWFKQELEARGVGRMEIVCDYHENFLAVPPDLMDEYLKLRPAKLHRYALDAVLALKKK